DRRELAQPGHHEQRRGFHVVAEHARARAHLELFARGLSWHAVLREVGIEGVDAADDPDVIRRARLLRRVDERVDHVQRGDGRVFERHVAVWSAFAAHRSERDHEVAHLDLWLRGATRSYTQERVDSELAELL